jgi:hypothetical protein
MGVYFSSFPTERYPLCAQCDHTAFRTLETLYYESGTLTVQHGRKKNIEFIELPIGSFVHIISATFVCVPNTKPAKCVVKVNAYSDGNPPIRDAICVGLFCDQEPHVRHFKSVLRPLN